jgi:hypothetical protein
METHRERRFVTRRKIGTGLITAAYALLLYMSLGARLASGGHHHFDPILSAEYGAPWPVALGVVVALAGIALAMVPIRHGEGWAIWTSLAMLAILFGVRITTDARCLAVLDPHQHGCHTFMIAVLVGVVGLALARK